MRPDALCGPSWIERPLRTNPAARTRAVRCTDGRERRFSPTPFPESFPVVSETSPALTTLNIDMVQALALAVLAYYGGSAIKKRVAFLERFSVPSPVVGGMPVAFVFSVLEANGILSVTFDTKLQSMLMLAFFTTIGLMASLKLIKQGGKLLVAFLAAVTALCFVQNAIGIGITELMGYDFHYGILAGSVSMMGGLGTAAAFGPYFENLYGISGGTVAAVTAATFGMVAALTIGGPFGEWLIRRYKVKTPLTDPDMAANLHIPDEHQTDVIDEHSAAHASFTEQLFKAGGMIAVCMALGSFVSNFLADFITLPAYIGSMIVAAFVRNFSDFTGKLKIDKVGLNAVADISLALFVTMAINSLKLHELVHLALPLVTILALQTICMLLYAWLVFFLPFGKNYTTVMLTVGGIGFSMGATANGLANMQALSEKYGPNPQSWLIVGIVGAFLIDLINALIITWMGSLSL